MAKNTNIKDFVADLADAIRHKKGTTDLINPQDFANEIRSIKSEDAAVKRKDVNFYDYDGTLLFSYTTAEAQALSSLPIPEDHPGLIFDGWNWNYEDVVALDYPMNIGAMYRTDDGKTRLYLTIEDDNTTITLNIAGLPSWGELVINFGDGSDTITTNSSSYTAAHTYTKGEYVLALSANNNSYFSLKGTSLTSNSIGRANGKERNALRKVELGDGCGVGAYAFTRCVNLQTITCPKSIRQNTTLGWSDTFSGCVSLQCVHIPTKAAYIYGMFEYCFNLGILTMPKEPLHIVNLQNTGLQYITFPDGYTGATLMNSNISEFRFPKAMQSVPGRMFNNCKNIKHIEEPDTVTSHNAGYTFSDCGALESVVLSQNLTTIKAHDFAGTRALKEVIVPKGVDTIETYAFYYCYAEKFDFSQCLQIPTLQNTNAFTYTNADKKIIVPDELYDEWISATNWSTYASFIVKSSEYNE